MPARYEQAELLGLPVEKIGAYEFLNAVKKAQEDYKMTATEDSKLQAGMEAHEGVVRIDPYDKQTTANVDLSATRTGIAELMLGGDERGFADARRSVANANSVTKPYLNAGRKLIMSNNLNSFVPRRCEVRTSRVAGVP